MHESGMDIRVLIVDDERDYREMLSERLITRGFAVWTAPNGPKAIDRTRMGGIDVVILDVQMPEMDGITVLHEIRNLDPLVEVILLTGRGSVQTAVTCMKAGAFDYIMKPADINELIEKLTQAYQKKAEREERIRNAEIRQVLLARNRD